MKFKIVILALLLLNGCVKRSVVKLEASPESRRKALEIFKEGMDLLYVDNESALNKFSTAHELDNQLVAAYYNAALAAHMLDKLDISEHKYEQCLEIKSDQPQCFLNLIEIKQQLNKEAEIKSLIAEYEKKYPEVLFWRIASAKVAVWKKKFSLAQKLLREVIAIDAENIQSLYLISQIFYEQKKYDAAMWVVKNALEHAPSHGGFHMLLGHLYKAKGQMLDALDSYSLAVKFQPTAEVLASYGALLMKQGRNEESLPILIRLKELYPNDSAITLNLGNAYMNNKMFVEAKKMYEQSLKLDPNDLSANFNLGLLYLEQKPKEVQELERLKVAKKYFDTYLEKGDPSSNKTEETTGYIELLSEKIEFEEMELDEEIQEDIEENIENSDYDGVTEELE